MEALQSLPGQGKARAGEALLRLARQSAAYYLKRRSYMPAPAGLPRTLLQQAPVFVTITRQGKPRGCMGSLMPHTANLATEVILMAAEAARRDRRVRPVQAGELSGLRFAVSIVGGVRPVSGPEELNPRRYGLLVSAGRRFGALLPGEARTVKWQIAQCRRMAGIARGGPARMFRFETLRFDEK